MICSVLRVTGLDGVLDAAQGTLFVSLFVLLLAHNTEILGRTRVIENNLLLGI